LEAFALGSWFVFFWWWRFFVFLAYFVYAFVNVSFELFADEVALSEGVCSCCDCEFTCDDAGDFSALPAFGIVEQCVLEY
jgi:hypothetical protein